MLIFSLIGDKEISADIKNIFPLNYIREVIDSPHNFIFIICAFIARLMTYSLGLASRGIRHPVNGDLFASLSRDEHGAGTANIHAGSALLATGGVCLLGDLTYYKRDRIDALQPGVM